MASIANLLRGTDREFFDLFERAGANIVHAAELLDEMLSRYPETQDMARDILACEHDRRSDHPRGVQSAEPERSSRRSIARTSST